MSETRESNVSPIEQKQQQVETLMRLAPVIPVVIIDDAKAAVPMARALVAGGIPTIEVTLRTPAALEAIRAIAAEVEGAVVGCGTALTARDLQAALQAGARFAVSPGTSPHLLRSYSSGCSWCSRFFEIRPVKIDVSNGKTSGFRCAL